MRKIIKRISLFCLLGFFLALFIVYQFFFPSLTAFVLHTYSISKWGEPITYESLVWEGKRLIIKQPKLNNETSFRADSLALQFHFFWEKRRLSIDVELQKPQWHVQSSFVSEWKNWKKISNPEEKWMKVIPTFSIKEGTLAWDSNEPLQKMCFDLEGNSQGGGSLKVYFNEDTQQNKYVTLHALNTHQVMEVSCKCNDVDCSVLAQVLQVLGVAFPSSWSITSGYLCADLKAIFPDSQRPYLEGEMTVEGVVFQGKGSKLQGNIGKAFLKLEKNHIGYNLDHQVSTMIGQVDIYSPSSLTYESESSGWKIGEIEGRIQLNHIQTAFIDLKAIVEDPYHDSHWNLQGSTNLNAQRSPQLDLTLLCSSAEQPNGRINFSISHPSVDNTSIKMQLAQLSHIEVDFLQTILSTQWPIFRECTLEQGEVSASVEADVTSQGIQELHIKHFQASDCSMWYRTENALCHFGQLRGYGKVHLGRENMWESLQAGIHVEDGEIQFEGIAPHIPITDIQAHFLLDQGLIKHSLVTLQLAGLKGKVDIDWGDLNQMLIFKLEGVGQEIADFLPPDVQNPFRQHFFEDRVFVVANVKKLGPQIDLEGSLQIEEQSNKMNIIHFGCELKQQKTDLTTYYTPYGWFYAQHLPLHKFLSPFIFRNERLYLSGEGECKGSFDDRSLTIKYDADQLKIENENLCITANHIHSSVPGELIGSHQIDLQTHSYIGKLPLQSATYLEKNSGFLFEDIQGTVTFKNHYLHIEHLETHCEGLFFGGELALDYSDPSPDVFNVKIECPVFSGKVSQVQHFLDRFKAPSFLQKIPLDGEIVGRGKGLSLGFAFIPKDFGLHVEFVGSISNGAMALEGFDCALEGIDMDIDYNHQTQNISFSDIQGALLIGKCKRVEEFLLAGNHVHIRHVTDPDIDFDFIVTDHSYELLRVVGHTTRGEDGIKSLLLDHDISHVSCLYPQIWECQWKDWSQVLRLDCSSQFDIGVLLQDLGRFRQTGFLFLSSHMIDALSQCLPLEGKGLLDIHRLPDQSYSYQLEGRRVKLGRLTEEHYALFKGSKKDKKWMIDQLQWDQWNAYGELEQIADSWKIPFFGLNAKENLVVGLEGVLSPEEGLFTGKLKYCEINTACIDQWEILQPFVSKWSPKGSVKIHGDIEWRGFLTHLWDGLTASLEVKPCELSFRDYPLKISHGFHVDISPNHIFSLENVECHLPPFDSQSTLHLKQLKYRLTEDFLDGFLLHFHLPCDQLLLVTQMIQHHFPDYCDFSWANTVAKSRRQGDWRGSLTMDCLHPSRKRCIHALFDDASYTFRNSHYDLKNLEVCLLGDELTFTASSQHERLPFQVNGQTHWPSCALGTCSILAKEAIQPLLLKWTSSEQGIKVNSLKGQYSGCFFDLEESKEITELSKWATIEGSVVFDWNHMCPMLPSSVVETIRRLKLGSPFVFTGNVCMDPMLGDSLLETIFLKGKISSEEPIIKGFQLQCLDADMQYVPGRLDIQNLLIRDPAGIVKSDHIVALFERNNKRWNLFFPHLCVKNVRLMLLRDTESSMFQGNSKIRSLLIKRINVNNFSGQLDQPKTWQAEGNLHFLNPTRKSVFYPLLAIPAEIILRLGLDPHVLNPVTGMIFFNLQEERLYLTRFKDVFSEGRGSKFYLAQSPDPSWMDFDGNLFVQVRMKQYNLIFKLAELFTVSIQGNIKKPLYALHKYSKSSRKGHGLSLISNSR